MPDTTTGATIPEVSHHHTLVNDTNLHYVTAGIDGTPILLVHGSRRAGGRFASSSHCLPASIV